jgi:REP element-mobilizing transposase RayT
VTARAPKGLALFRAATDRRLYLDLLAEQIGKRLWSLRTYCLMTTHVHLLVLTPETNLGLGMKALHERFVRFMHRDYAGHGHLFGDRFGNRLVLDDGHEFACLRYIARNPVAAGLCAAADEWEWSGHRALAGLTEPPPWLDLPAVRATIGATDYQALVATTDARLMNELAAHLPDTWIAHAVDDHHIPITHIAAALDIHVATAYRRLSAAREKRDSPPVRSHANGGTVP